MHVNHCTGLLITRPPPSLISCSPSGWSTSAQTVCLFLLYLGTYGQPLSNLLSHPRPSRQIRPSPGKQQTLIISSSACLSQQHLSRPPPLPPHLPDNTSLGRLCMGGLLLQHTVGGSRNCQKLDGEKQGGSPQKSFN